jgi:plasmid maintenance system antidote protein VapI
MSQTDLARQSGIHPSTISRACAGMELSEDAEYRIREALGLVSDVWDAPRRATPGEAVSA